MAYLERLSSKPSITSGLGETAAHDMIENKWTDSVWVACIVAANVIFFVRKIILAKHGHPFQFLDLAVKDGCRLRALAARQGDTKVKLFYNWINWSLRLLFVSGLFILVLTRIGR